MRNRFAFSLMKLNKSQEPFEAQCSVQQTKFSLILVKINGLAG
ncbi:hypothetical protein AVDCRST_MAG81-3432 [uncultured Synechococcales cyanobacterium]|uniref:Uncharacterized protein n=1 Tax=uncultured Synechococcales cyanobacterium TaxID=1936017 RepID=A0A6J4VP46_9CYAN|nr:hypothetical protein AVDCRST_MAG81-3432 [uncultured Synechococcales cyanobacterium]